MFKISGWVKWVNVGGFCILTRSTWNSTSETTNAKLRIVVIIIQRPDKFQGSPDNMTPDNMTGFGYQKKDLLIPGGAATCSEGFVICFLKVPLACLGSMAAAVQPNSLGNSQKKVNKTFGTSGRPTQYYPVTTKGWTTQMDLICMLFWRCPSNFTNTSPKQHLE